MPAAAVDLMMTSVIYKGRTFKTGQPVTFPYLRNLISSRSLGLSKDYLRQFQCDIEPSGIYVNFNEFPDHQPPRDWEKGYLTFRNPLVIRFNARLGGSYDKDSWKMRLHLAFKRQRGMALTAALKAAGYDAIVTVDKSHTEEIVKL